MRIVFNSIFRGFSAGLIAVAVVGAAAAAHAQGTISASASLFGVADGDNYDYTLTLNNDVSSTDPIQTFWFAWFPGADLLPTAPTVLQTPANWTSSVQGGVTLIGGYPYPDGYSIEFTTSDSGSALNPGHSLIFTFTSADTPDTIAGLSPYPYFIPNYYQVGISYTYMNGAPGPGQEPTGDVSSITAAVVPAPEPSTIALLSLGGSALMLLRKRLGRR